MTEDEGGGERLRALIRILSHAISAAERGRSGPLGAAQGQDHRKCRRDRLIRGSHAGGIPAGVGAGARAEGQELRLGAGAEGQGAREP